MASTINIASHGFTGSESFRFANLVPENTGVLEDVTYYVLAAGITSGTFEFSLTDGGAAITLDNAITDGSIVGTDTYVINSGDMLPPPIDLRHVAYVTSLPTLPDTAYPVGALAYLSTDGIIYRNDADVWETSLGDTGPAGADGTVIFAASVYQRAASPPATPTVDTGSYNFATSTLTPPAGWSASPPAADGNPLYVSTGIFEAAIGGTDSTVTWTATAELVSDGADGSDADSFIPGYGVPSGAPAGTVLYYLDLETGIYYFWNGSSWDVTSAPGTVATPSTPTSESTETNGLVRLTITLAAYTNPALRMTEVEATPQYTTVYNTPGDPGSGIASEGWDWDQALTLPYPPGTTVITVPAIPEATYEYRARVQDTFGQYSAWSTEGSQVMGAGSDALYSALSDIANGVVDGSITRDSIKLDAIEAQHISSRAIEADALAAVIILTSLLQTAADGNRVEIDDQGIRMYDASEVLQVRIPTDGTAVYIAGEVNASDLTVNATATFNDTMSLSGDGVMTLQDGVSAPTSPPTLTASVESSTLTGSVPTTRAAAVAWDGTNYWFPANPDTGYVAHKYSSAYAYVSSIASNGTISSETGTKGGTGHVTDTTDALQTTADTHIASVIDMPTGLTNMRITKVSVYCAGYTGSADLTNGVWDTGGTSLGQSASYTAAQRTFSNGNDVQYNKTLSSPTAALSSGQTIWAGFRRTDTADGVFWSKNDGSGKVTKSADGTGASGTGWATYDSNSKPNVYVTYSYDVDTRVETNPMIGVASDGTYVYTLDSAGKVWAYVISTGAPVATGTLDVSSYFAASVPTANAGLYYDSDLAKLVVLTYSVSTAAFVRQVLITLTAGVPTYSSTVDGTGTTVGTGASSTIKGGAFAETFRWYVVDNTVKKFSSVAVYQADHDFGVAATVAGGVCHDGTQFRGWATATSTKLWKFSSWDWSTGGSTWQVAHAWYDGANHTTAGPSASVTVTRRQRLQVQNGSLGSSQVIIYAYQGASPPAAGSWWQQVADSAVARYLTAYAVVTHDVTTNEFSSGAAAIIQSSTAGWTISGDGTQTVTSAPTIQTFATGTAATYTTPAKCKAIQVELQGGGGGGGASDATTSAQSALGGGGGGGGYARKLIASPDATYKYTVGALGAGATTDEADGTAGGSTKWLLASDSSTLFEATGGGGGEGGSAGAGTVIIQGGDGGIGTAGSLTPDILAGGDDGGGGMKTGTLVRSMGKGGSSHWGGGGRFSGANSGGSGIAANGNGGGGGGAWNELSQSGFDGGNGTVGRIVVTEFY